MGRGGARSRTAQKSEFTMACLLKFFSLLFFSVVTISPQRRDCSCQTWPVVRASFNDLESVIQRADNAIQLIQWIVLSTLPTNHFASTSTTVYMKKKGLKLHLWSSCPIPKFIEQTLHPFTNIHCQSEDAASAMWCHCPLFMQGPFMYL